MIRPRDERIFEKFKKKIGSKFLSLENNTLEMSRKLCEILCALKPVPDFELSLQKVFVKRKNSHRNEIVFKVKKPLDFSVQIGERDVDLWINYIDPVKKKTNSIKIEMTPENFQDYVELLFHKNERKINNATLRFWYLIFKRHVQSYDTKRKGK